MCEIYGGPHFTIKCPHSYSSGYSTDYYSNAYLQPQPYQPSYQRANQWCNPEPSDLFAEAVSRLRREQDEIYEHWYGGSSSEYPPCQSMYQHPNSRDVSSHTRLDFTAFILDQQ